MKFLLMAMLLCGLALVWLVGRALFGRVARLRRRLRENVVRQVAIHHAQKHKTRAERRRCAICTADQRSGGMLSNAGRKSPGFRPRA